MANPLKNGALFKGADRDIDLREMYEKIAGSDCSVELTESMFQKLGTIQMKLSQRAWVNLEQETIDLSILCLKVGASDMLSLAFKLQHLARVNEFEASSMVVQELAKEYQEFSDKYPHDLNK
ncbi:MAG: hypothetical protein CMP10_08590 [Zetaproteobacteria bacterium]|nr:hypothetical protein [Pseudobdellovibrionaceae bacterium]|tara:strand:- start:1427 stop:1792 length:366 start_codon:yes stop_codon:yes gene_type:complete